MTTKSKYRPAYDKEQFGNKTAILVEVIARTCLNDRGVQIIPGEEMTFAERGNAPTREQAEYFVRHADLWVRWFYANNQTWKRAIESPKNGGNYGRDYCYTFVGHWADAFLKDPTKYIERHTMDALENQS